MIPEQTGIRSDRQENTSERRKYPRFDVDLPVRYHRSNLPISRNGRVMNLSEGGLLIHLPDPMETGQELKLNLSFFMDSALDSLEAMSEVVWSEIHLFEPWGDYRSGIRFTAMSEKDSSKLKDFMKDLS
jgi:c-di-GMP-binding flagellar brake protein YcgR